VTDHAIISFQKQPALTASGVVGGNDEHEGPLQAIFDHTYDDLWLGKSSFEQAQSQMVIDAINYTLEKSALTKTDIDYIVSGDLINQITPTTFGVKQFNKAFLGLYSACATVTESLIVGALLYNMNEQARIVCGASSHFATAERQFRFPTEYGGQIPPTAQRTVTGAGYALLKNQAKGPKITQAVIGRVVDIGETDPFHMGAAMAPAAVDTISRYFKANGDDPNSFDYIVTGDLGRIGSQIAYDDLLQEGVKLDREKFLDCGKLIFNESQNFQAGGSGAGCPAVVMLGYFLPLLTQKKVKKVMLVATGALQSSLSVQQKLSIPAIAHAIVLEVKESA